MSFGAPWYLLALAVVPLAVLGYLLMDRRRRKAAAAFAAPATMPSVVTSRPGWRRHAPMVVYALALIALALAFARPERTVAVPDGRAAVVLATDRSSSMRASDVRPSRITAVRRAATGFLDDVPREVKVGSVAFNDRVTRIETPRLARTAVRESVDALAAEGGTATGEAIAASLRSLERARGPKGKNPAAIILLSDGFSTSGRDPLEAAREARRKGVRVYTVSLGTPTGTIDVERRDGTVSPPRGPAGHRIAARDRAHHQGPGLPRRRPDQARGGLRPARRGGRHAQGEAPGHLGVRRWRAAAAGRRRPDVAALLRPAALIALAMVSGMRVKLALAAALATGTALVGVGVGGLVGVDRQLEAATPQQSETRVVSEGDGKRGDCPADKADQPRPSSHASSS